VAELRKGAGTQWDPTLVEKFLECLDAPAAGAAVTRVPAEANA